MEIRAFEDSDGAQVSELWKRIFCDEADHNRSDNAIARKRKVQPELFFVAEEDGQIIGTAMGGYDGHRGWLYSIAVDDAFRRQGLGAELVRTVERALAAMDCPKINLQIRVGNEEVAAFYRHLGYETEPRVSMGKVV